ncbi:MAG: Gfo/Idh/MocA family oxidoreductase [Kiritimatiellae bacterium]|nr:Gfo/Idh/MocA family oxidoreductase [Kiritimatiellia bacterium]
MKSTIDRRGFLQGTAWMSLAAAAAGCQMDRICCGGGAPMAEFAAPPLKRVRIGFVGVGARGTYAVKRICQMPGVEITALCDIKAEAIKGCQDHLKAKKLPPAKEYLGPEAYKALCRECECDVVYACTPWMLHLPVAVEAMKCGKHSLVEVPATMDVDGCWELVETSEKTHRHCMMLENCCYGETEMLALNMCRLGLLGELVYGGAGYLHYSTNRGIKNGPSWRNEWYIKHHGNFYPTHGLGPVAQYMDINRGDRFDYLVSVDTGSFGPPAMAEAYFPPDSWQRNVKLKAGDYSASIIRTVKGHAIYLAKSCFVPHPYSRINMVQGTKGIFMDYPLRIAFEKQFSDGTMPHKVFDDAKTEEYRQKYKHPMWRDVGAIATKVGGHGGMDFIMDLRWIYCLQNGLPLDMNVYDLASWSCLCEITERSVLKRSAPTDIPDFTRGAWKTLKPLGIHTVDIKKMGVKGVDAGPQQDVGSNVA